MPMRVSLLLVVTLAAVVASCRPEASAEPSAAPASAPERASLSVRIDQPVDGSMTHARTTRVSGRVSGVPPGTEPWVIVTVDGRDVEPDVRADGRFSLDVVLARGDTTISAEAEAYTRAGTRLPRSPTARTVVTRVGPRPAPRLDLATAYLVTDWSRDVYWLCGEGDGCGRTARCFAVTEQRVDCPVATLDGADRRRHCGLVMSVRLVGRRLLHGPYDCTGRFTDPRRFVRPQRVVTGKRFRIDERDADHLVDEAAELNRYGLPRFSVVGDVHIP